MHIRTLLSSNSMAQPDAAREQQRPVTVRDKQLEEGEEEGKVEVEDGTDLGRSEPHG